MGFHAMSLGTASPWKGWTMTVYAIAQIKFLDREAYDTYAQGFMEVFQNFKGSLLAVDDHPVVMEGAWGFERMVLISFPSQEDLLDWYESPAYQALAEHRWNASEGIIVMAKGF